MSLQVSVWIGSDCTFLRFCSALWCKIKGFPDQAGHLASSSSSSSLLDQIIFFVRRLNVENFLFVRPFSRLHSTALPLRNCNKYVYLGMVQQLGELFAAITCSSSFCSKTRLQVFPSKYICMACHKRSSKKFEHQCSAGHPHIIQKERGELLWVAKETGCTTHL